MKQFFVAVFVQCWRMKTMQNLMLLKNQNLNSNCVVDLVTVRSMMVVELKLKLDAVSVQCYDSRHSDERDPGHG